jgi:hypothetical protein
VKKIRDFVPTKLFCTYDNRSRTSNLQYLSSSSYFGQAIDLKSDCKDHKLSYLLMSTVPIKVKEEAQPTRMLLDGEWVNYIGYVNAQGQPHAWGKIQWDDGVKYKGEFVNGKKHGKGTSEWPDGNKHDGGYKNDKKHGWGTFYWASDGEKFEGLYIDDLRKYGTHHFSDGRVYIGEFANDHIEGKGKLTVSGDFVYEGGFKHMKSRGKYTNAYVFNGWGEITFTSVSATGARHFSGTFENDEMVQGTMTFIDDSEYNGQFKNGKMHGEGTLRQANGVVYSGRFKNGERDIPGHFTLPDGRVIGRKIELGNKVKKKDDQVKAKKTR